MQKPALGGFGYSRRSGPAVLSHGASQYARVLSSFTPQASQSPILIEIDGAIGDLDDALEDYYSSLYPPRFPYFQFTSFQSRLRQAKAMLNDFLRRL